MSMCNVDQNLCRKQYKLEAKIKNVKEEVKVWDEKNRLLVDRIKDEVDRFVRQKHHEFMRIAHDKGVTLLDYADRVKVEVRPKDRHQLPSEANGWRYELPHEYLCYVDGELVYQY